MFNTSLDHILDYHIRIYKAYRILKAWWSAYCFNHHLERASDSTPDAVHFHHFIEFEIVRCLSDKGTQYDEVDIVINLINIDMACIRLIKKM